MKFFLIEALLSKIEESLKSENERLEKIKNEVSSKTFENKSLSERLKELTAKLTFKKKSEAEAEITAVSENGKMVDFKVSAWDETGPIGSGTHTRAVINCERFLAKCNGKLQK